MREHKEIPDLEFQKWYDSLDSKIKHILSYISVNMVKNDLPVYDWKDTNIIEGFSFGPKAFIPYWGSNVSDGGVGLTIGGEAAYKWVFGGFTVEPIFNLLIPLVKYYGTGLNVDIGVNLGYAW